MKQATLVGLRRKSAALLLALATIGCDQVTKHAATVALEHAPRLSYLRDSVRLEYALNSGGFLSLGAGLARPLRVLLFQIVPGAVLVVIAGLALRRRVPPRTALALVCVCAGGASNLADRALRGSVVDFLNLGIGPLRTGIFNVADVAILCGVLLALVPERVLPGSRER